MAFRSQPITTVSEYSGESVAVVSATQLGSAYTAREARRVVDEWVEFFSSGPTPIHELEFTTRTPARLFKALAGQRQLSSLTVKWGDYEDLSSIAELERLTFLSLRGASRVSNVEPIRRLVGLRTLVIEGFDTIDDPEALGDLSGLRGLELGGAWTSPKNGHIPSLEFLRDLPQLETLLLHTLVVDSKDYTPVLDLRHLRKVRIMQVRGMSPSIDELKAALPWDG